jgi:hypothetical protein
VPPLYHLYLDEFQKRREQIKKHYAFFSPLHRETAFLPLTEFQWLTDDRLVQRTSFGDQIEMVANFSTTDYTYNGTVVPKRGIMAKWMKTGKRVIYSAGGT